MASILSITVLNVLLMVLWIIVGYNLYKKILC